MTERINHMAEAKRVLGSYKGWEGNWPFDVAQIHATLALVEQQRISNLIALGEQWEDAVYPALDSVLPELKPEVKEALGL